MNDEVLYLETDEEITAAIDKMLKAKSANVKIVVPKRSTLLQSIVNLKLLKKAAETGGKQLVLVTGDRTSTHLAGRVGLPVAATLKSQATTPAIEPQAELASDVIEAEEESPQNPLETPKSKPDGVMGPKPSYAKPMMVRSSVGESEPAATETVPKKKRVPDFGTLQKRLLIGGGVVALLGILYLTNMFLTKANVTLYAKGAMIKAAFTFTVDPSLSQTDKEKLVLAGKTLKADKALSANATATGKKDVGTKASGTITATNNCYNPGTIPAGTTFTAGGLNFVSTQAVAVSNANIVAGNCSPTTASVPVQAGANGDQYNLAARGYTTSAYPSSGANSMSFNGSQMSGGTSKTVNVLTQEDINKAKDDALAKDKETAQKDLENKADDNQKAISESFTATASGVTASPAVGEEASSAVVTIQVTYTELAVDKAEYEDLVKTQEQKQVTDQNVIYDTGIDTAVLTAKPAEAGGRQAFDFAADAYGGAKVEAGEVAKQIKGKRYGDAADIAAKLPGVEKAEISLTPAWATKIPNLIGNIKITIKVAPKS